MKTINIKWIFVGIISALLLNLKAQEKTDKELIIDTWVCQEDFTSYWIFDKNGTAISYYHNDIDGTFSYSIIKENQSHVSLLKLVNIKNNEEIYDYYIDSLGEDILQITPMGRSLQNTEFYNCKSQQGIKEPSSSKIPLKKEEESITEKPESIIETEYHKGYRKGSDDARAGCKHDASFFSQSLEYQRGYEQAFYDNNCPYMKRYYLI